MFVQSTKYVNHILLLKYCIDLCSLFEHFSLNCVFNFIKPRQDFIYDKTRLIEILNRLYLKKSTQKYHANTGLFDVKTC